MSDKLPLKMRPLVFIDIETTGLDPAEHEMIEFAGVMTTPQGTPIDDVEFKIMPLHPENASPEALKINGYNPKDWQDAVGPGYGIQKILSFCENGVIVGQNPSFDLGFINALIKQQGLKNKMPYHKVDTATLAYTTLVPLGLKSVSLGGICDFLGISNKGAHGAMRDVERCMEAYFKMTRATWFDKWQWKRRNCKS